MICKRQRTTELNTLVFEGFKARVSFHIERILDTRMLDIEELIEYLGKFEETFTVSSFDFNCWAEGLGSQDNDLIDICLCYVLVVLNPWMTIFTGRCMTKKFNEVDFTADVKCSLLLMTVATFRPEYMRTMDHQITKILESDLGEDRYKALYPLGNVMFTHKSHLRLLAKAFEKITADRNNTAGMIRMTGIAHLAFKTADELYKDDEKFMEEMKKIALVGCV